ncbi:hypothetical protein LCR01_20960 [Companilactobacillus crustorum]|uniref:Uncharacterized protein n=3 Tax=Companilactobacillus TaxID=2767879 RepID=A0A837REB4_9LACO|nr:hypothetical protein [Companilactobacillus crustorum]HCD07139.1 hypothetical protein [Lactobacillus sp.]APU71733.1 hypothetical protein BI355_1416 [Companilactobacillus crustorum]KRK40589.1 hypothetical protein FD26_GL001994 [Companilactobacillus crustorum JCM 15951]KRO17060.1 hypothetical protein IV63_GL001965 [Companilactobacillus crustorum]WDT66245.1 hypothetical protein NV391_03295 [Companilactobacillus crustorum]
MDDTGKWLEQQVSDLAKKQKAYENRAFLVAMQQVIQEQNMRTEQLKGEVDGRLWNHEQW